MQDEPVLSVDFQGDHPVLYWKNNSTDALELEADYGFSRLTIQLPPGYQDNTRLLASGNNTPSMVSTMRKYNMGVRYWK